MPIKFYPLLLALLLAPSGLQAQPAPPATPPVLAEDEEIIVTGQRQRGAVLGDIKPTVQLDGAAIRSFGATSAADLLQALSPQLRSSQGNGTERPIVLINGRRTSSYAEVADLPSEAIVRVDILPEEAAIKYGYAPTRVVVNFVLRRRFRAVTSEVSTSVATEGGRTQPVLNLNYLRIHNNERITIDSKVEYRSALREDERDIARTGTPDPRAFRTLLSEAETYSLSGVFNRQLQPSLALTLSGRVEYTQTDALTGLANATFVVPATGPFASLAPQFSRSLAEAGPLLRNATSLGGQFGVLLNKERPNWRWSIAGNYERSDNRTLTETGVDVSAVQAAVQAGDPTVNPAEPLTASRLGDRLYQLSNSVSDTIDIDGTIIGTLLALPAGDVSTTFRGGLGWAGLDSVSQRSGVRSTDAPSRRQAEASASIDIPIARRSDNILAVLGNLNFNANVGTQQLSDAGTLLSWGTGLNWTPVPPLRLIFSYNQQDVAPTLQQRGAAAIVATNVRVFDFVRGSNVLVTRVTGGNEALQTPTRHVFKAGLTLKPFSSTDLTLTANYTHSRTRNVIETLSSSTPIIQAAFATRFTRDASGTLVQVDSRPVNFDQARREDLRWGLNFSMPLKTPPQSPEVMAKFRALFAPPASATQNPSAAPNRPASGQASSGGGGRGGGGGFGGARLQLAAYHSIRFRDDVQVRAGLPLIDLLDGGTIGGSSGGRPQHEIEFQGGVSRLGLGARLSANWQSGTQVSAITAGGSALRYSDLTTLNLRLFVNPTGRPDWIIKYPWLRGSRLTVSIDNLLNDRIFVTNAAGSTPSNLQPALIDPLGRTVRISLRKLFY